MQRSGADLSRLYPYHLPLTPEWEEKKDIFGQSAMMGAGAGMFIKNPLYVRDWILPLDEPEIVQERDGL